jgi:hypothetical protein
MNKLISILNLIAKGGTTLADLIMKIPKPIWWALKMIPGVNTLWNSLEGARTVLLNVLAAAILFMEKTDWTNISGWLCELLTSIFQLFNKSWVCDSSVIPAIATSLLIIANIFMRIISGGKIAANINPLTSRV